jgi:antitoxin FitA
MATIQVRDLPEDAYEVLRLRARRSGQSLQAYMRDQLTALAARRTKQEAIAAIERIHATPGYRSPSIESIVRDLDEARR